MAQSRRTWVGRLVLALIAPRRSPVRARLAPLTKVLLIAVSTTIVIFLSDLVDRLDSTVAAILGV